MATFSATIIASADDAVETAGTVDITSSAININAATSYGGWRFQNVTIPQGSTINTCTMDLYFTSGSFDDPDVTIWAEDTDDAAAFTTGASNISGRTPTTATASWDVGGVGVGLETTVDFSAVVKEVVDRPGWASGNDLVVIMKGDDAGTLMRVRTYDSGSGDYGTINIDYTAPSTGQPTIARARQVPGMRQSHGQQGW